MNVARSCEIGVALGLIAGIARPAHPTVAKNLNWVPNLDWIPPLNGFFMKRANMMVDVLSGRECKDCR